MFSSPVSMHGEESIMAFISRAISRACAVVALATVPITTNAEPQNGWWWNPDESGRGFFIEMTGGVIYIAGYFYDANGRATWLSSGGPVADAYSYSGTLQSYRDGQSVFGTYHPPAPALNVGPVSLTFSDDTHGTLTWPGGTFQIERQYFGVFSELVLFEPFIPLDPVFRPKTGWWWNSDESGSGYSVEIQGDQLFVVAFMYNDDGEPIWYFTAGPMSSPTHFEGDWLEFSGGQTLAGPYRAPTSRSLGHVIIDFASYDHATITFSEGVFAKRASTTISPRKAGYSRVRVAAVLPQLLPPPHWNDPSSLPPYFACKIVREDNTTGDAGTTGGVFITNSTWTYDAIFKRDTNAYYQGSYTLEAGSSYSYVYDDHDTSNGCHTYGSTKGAQDLEGHLYIYPSLYYEGRLAVKPLGPSVTLHTNSCVNVQSQPPDTIEQVFNVTTFPFDAYYYSVQNPNSASTSVQANTLNGILVPSLYVDPGTQTIIKWNCTSYPFPPPLPP
jgi:hypothetical protein